MLKKVMIAALFAASALVTAPTAASAGDYEICMLNNGCFFYVPDDNSHGYWVCYGPPIYMDCVPD